MQVGLRESGLVAWAKSYRKLVHKMTMFGIDVGLGSRADPMPLLVVF